MIGSKRVFLGLLGSLVALSSIASSPVHYVENKNQWPAGFHYGAEFPGIKVLLKKNSLYFLQYSQTSEDEKSPKSLQTTVHESHGHKSGDMSLATFELFFLNALNPKITSSQKQKTLYNYYHGNDRSSWGQGASSYAEVLYSGMYDGIDLKLYSENGQMKYDWVISPCANPKQIRFSYEGIEYVDLLDENLVIKTKLGEVLETKPFAYQIVNGERRIVHAAFEIDGDAVSFVFPNGYDSNYELIIDPFIIFSSYSGSTFDNWGNSATPDSRGNLYSGGMVSNTAVGGTFPTTPGAFQVTHQAGVWDVGILKYDSVGANLLYVTYVGGNGVETPQSLVVNKDDELLVLGATSSSNFPGTIPNSFKGGQRVDPLNGVDYLAGTDIFVVRLSVNGANLLASTYLGGSANDGINFVAGFMGTLNKVESELSRNYGDQLRGDIITDSEGNVYIASNTRSADFPVLGTVGVPYHGGTHDGVVAKFTPSLVPVWTRLMGGSGADIALSIKIASSGSIFVAGGTNSTNIAGMNGLLTTAPGGIDGWIAELSSDGKQIFNSTYLGTSSYDQVYFIDLATNGDVVAYGQTKGMYPIATKFGFVYSNLGGGQFLHRLTSNLKTTVFSTTFGKGGSTPDISPTAFLVNACDNIYMAGWGGTVNATTVQFGQTQVTRNYVGGTTNGLPTTADAFQVNSIAGNDFYMMVLTGDGSELVYATFLGGIASSTHVDGGTSRFDKRGIVYHAVCAGCGGNPTDFPAFNVPESRSQNRSTNCNNAAFKFDLSSLRAGIETNNAARTARGLRKVCLPDGIVFENKSIGGEIFEWDFGDGDGQVFLSKEDIYHHYAKPGKYTIKLKATDRSTCIGVDSTTEVIEVFQPDMDAGPDHHICYGSTARLTAYGGAGYAWKALSNKYTTSQQNPIVLPDQTTDYQVTITDINGCIHKDTVTVKVVPGIDLSFDLERVGDCTARPYAKVINTSELKEDETATFFFGDGTSSQETEAMHSYVNDGIYTISLRGSKEFCTYQVSETARFVNLTVPNVITPGLQDGLNDVFKIEYGSPAVSREGLDFGLKIMDRWGVRVYQNDHYTDDWDGTGVDGGVYYYELDIPGEVRCKGWIHLKK